MSKYLCLILISIGSAASSAKAENILTYVDLQFTQPVTLTAVSPSSKGKKYFEKIIIQGHDQCTLQYETSDKDLKEKKILTPDSKWSSSATTLTDRQMIMKFNRTENNTVSDVALTIICESAEAYSGTRLRTTPKRVSTSLSTLNDLGVQFSSRGKNVKHDELSYKVTEKYSTSGTTVLKPGKSTYQR